MRVAEADFDYPSLDAALRAERATLCIFDVFARGQDGIRRFASSRVAPLAGDIL